jgi:hypothetical protein
MNIRTNLNMDMDTDMDIKLVGQDIGHGHEHRNFAKVFAVTHHNYEISHNYDTSESRICNYAKLKHFQKCCRLYESRITPSLP